ncbi:acyltransferase [uncultured Paracoccus sp.]|uniref:acyltransferase family protein n=1 Tax=uncultured Paracoccus sp. TaxID=189685 RepID=UPI00262F5A23|nr:acyltransferase [uncultured Paracoccus sp.]
MASMAAPSLPTARLSAFDGLRGVAAAIVVLYHYLCLLHPSLTPGMSQQVHWLADTPLNILWNGRFSVAVFFVLSGFVMAAAAERRRDALVANSLTWYLRLALPVTASSLLAWGWLAAFPDSAQAMKDTLAAPSRWLDFTYQEPILPVWYAVADGMVANFVRGYSRFNNVLWTMQIELVGSLAIFVLYALTQGRARLLSLVAAGAAVLLWFSDAYMGFIFGAALYEAHRRDLLRSVPAVVPVAAFAAAVVLGGPGEGAHLRMDLPDMPEQWHLGPERGVVAGVAAALLIFSALTLPALARVFARPMPLFLGRISFGLYLVHVPPLYTIVAWSHLRGVPEIVLGLIYAVSVLALAWIFTLTVDEPSLRWLSALRTGSIPAGPSACSRGAPRK